MIARHKEKIEMAIAWALPKKIVMWCYIRLHAHATQTLYNDRAPDQITCFEALKAWGVD